MNVGKEKYGILMNLPSGNYSYIVTLLLALLQVLPHYTKQLKDIMSDPDKEAPRRSVQFCFFFFSLFERNNFNIVLYQKQREIKIKKFTCKFRFAIILLIFYCKVTRLPIFRVRISSWILSWISSWIFELDFRVTIFFVGFFWRFFLAVFFLVWFPGVSVVLC